MEHEQNVHDGFFFLIAYIMSKIVALLDVRTEEVSARLAFTTYSI